jgi:hypothetical protein
LFESYDVSKIPLKIELQSRQSVQWKQNDNSWWLTALAARKTTYAATE